MLSRHEGFYEWDTDWPERRPQTSGDPKVVAALQAHAVEVSELAQDGMAAMMRAARANMGRAASGGPR